MQNKKKPKLRAIFQRYFPGKLYYWLFTRKGKALSKNDFAKIKSIDKDFYQVISSRRCTGYCYFVCQHMAQLLKKGSVAYIAKKDLLSTDTTTYRIHVLYINNDWVFDTITRRQYPFDSFLKMCDGKIFRCFSYSDFKDYDNMDDFYSTFEDELTMWCNDNNCKTFADRNIWF